MALSKEKKKETLATLKEAAKDSKTIVFVNFHGLKMSDTTAFRRALGSQNVKFLVSKKTLMSRALSELGFTGTLPSLDGEVGIAYSTDEMAPAKEVFEFQKKSKDGVKILGGMFEGAFVDRETMLGIAAIPSKHVLYGMFANVVNSPIQGFVIALSEISKKKTA